MTALRRGSMTQEHEVLLHHVAHSSHRMALPADWTTEEVTRKLRVVFTDNPLVEAMLDDFEGLPNGHELSASYITTTHLHANRSRLHRVGQDRLDSPV